MAYADLKNCKIITAFITPFHEDGSINFEAIPDLIEHLLAHHTDGILLAGTTAESPTLTHDEELELFAAVQKVVKGRVPLIAGVGTNETRRLYRIRQRSRCLWWFCGWFGHCSLLQ
ncbi:Dihydrodipicolinate synthase [Streptococcus cristatus]|uniref:Dihydrodipicolinate synthase n=1 Tax=Streptococcus cristatus TaxID=45634 RepID=A0A139N0V6_STRCR|nr:Dihydrodipicolinate synthase [Streptococcus cristatus]